MQSTPAEAGPSNPDPVNPDETDFWRRSLWVAPVWVWILTLVASLLTLVANHKGIASGDDGVGYRAIADSLIDGNGLRYFLEDPLTVWPPLWPGLMAAISSVTNLNTVGAAIVLNALTVLVAVPVGYRLLIRVVHDQRLVIAGVLVMALGSSTMGFGHLLMTDYAFGVLVMAWMLAMFQFHESRRFRWLVLAAALIWVGFGLRYVGLYLIGMGGLWILLDSRRKFLDRLVPGIGFGLISIVVPVIWMLRNHSLDGTWTGPRYPSARGPIDNGFDILRTMGQWVLPGVLDDSKYLWAAVGGAVLAIAVGLGWMVLGALTQHGGIPERLRELWHWLGRPTGLLAVQAFGYLAYMLYVRSTTALNQLDMRLLNPAYLSLVVLALVLLDRLSLVGDGGVWKQRGLWTAYVWSAANVVLGIVAVFSFATGDTFFNGNYEAPLYREARVDAVLNTLPEDCELYSNLPNALYPELEAEWSPRETGLESNDPVDDLENVVSDVDSGTRACLVWLDEEPNYGHLHQLDSLEEAFDLELIAESSNIQVFELHPADSTT